ncbi:hypothetical protein K466DRAFT_83953 [Polyporus arcularius HHB13444]|uniref:Uncharacterized protein n=1 Tax=Polyporus arcularius HHB13444 TaxID=1314778 RepID=A0A5C3NME3_9APHY|nr:hypothetical protein K466DRAFT_83953 [Polyporus arcularius HHB13444]
MHAARCTSAARIQPAHALKIACHLLAWRTAVYCDLLGHTRRIQTVSTRCLLLPEPQTLPPALASAHALLAAHPYTGRQDSNSPVHPLGYDDDAYIPPTLATPCPRYLCVWDAIPSQETRVSAGSGSYRTQRRGGQGCAGSLLALADSFNSAAPGDRVSADLVRRCRPRRNPEDSPQHPLDRPVPPSATLVRISTPRGPQWLSTPAAALPQDRRPPRSSTREPGGMRDAGRDRESQSSRSSREPADGRRTRAAGDERAADSRTVNTRTRPSCSGLAAWSTDPGSDTDGGRRARTRRPLTRYETETGSGRASSWLERRPAPALCVARASRGRHVQQRRDDDPSGGR